MQNPDTALERSEILSTGLGRRLLRRRQDCGRQHPPAAHEDRGRARPIPSYLTTVWGLRLQMERPVTTAATIPRTRKGGVPAWRIKRITRRWLVNGLGVIVCHPAVCECRLFALAVRSYYYNSVQQIIISPRPTMIVHPAGKLLPRTAPWTFQELARTWWKTLRTRTEWS